MKFIILSSCPWRGMLQRPHQMARALAKLGHEVNFIEPSLRHIQHNNDEITLEELLKYNLNDSRYIDKVSIYSPVSKCNERIISPHSMRLLCEHLLSDKEQKSIIISYFPSYIQVINEIDSDFTLVYDCVDDHTDLEYSYWSSPMDIEYESLIMDQADFILTTSSSLFLNKSIGRENVFLSKNAVCLNDFKESERSEPVDLINIPKPRICYMGAVDKWFNTELFYKTVQSNPDKSFVLIGPINNKILDKQFPNLYSLGVKDHSQLKEYLHNMDVGIIPFRDDSDLIINCDPIKMYEYLACGLPVISTVLPDLFQDSEYIKTCSSTEEFIDSINKMLDLGIQKQNELQFLKENTWEKRAQNLVEVINSSCKNHEHKEMIYQDLEKKWGTYLESRNNPIIKSLYGLSFAETDPDKFLKLCKMAYELSQSKFTLRNYIVALYVHGQVEEAINIVLSDPHVNDLFKAELCLAQSIGDFNLVRIQLFLSIGKLDIVKDLLPTMENDPITYKFHLGNYYLLTGRPNEAYESYKEILSSPLLDFSPLYNHHLSKLLVRAGVHNQSQKAHFRALQLVDQLLKRESRLDKWKALFTEEVYCDHCGESSSDVVFERPDGQKIVSCIRCQLAYLEKIPTKDNLHKLYDQGYYNNSEIAGYTNNYNQEKKDYMFVPRLQWINKTISISPNKKILDIGCADGEFLEYAIQTGWEAYGLEISKEGYEESKKRGIQVTNNELMDAKFTENTFDCITLWDVVEHYVSPKEELTEIFRILKPGGKLYLSTPNHRKGLFNGKNWFGYNHSYEHLFYFDASTLIKMLISIGFQIDDSFTHEAGDWNFTNVRSVGHVLLLSARK